MNHILLGRPRVDKIHHGAVLCRTLWTPAFMLFPPRNLDHFSRLVLYLLISTVVGPAMLIFLLFDRLSNCRALEGNASRTRYSNGGARLRLQFIEQHRKVRTRSRPTFVSDHLHLNGSFLRPIKGFRNCQLCVS